jgi:hypothetical protein
VAHVTYRPLIEGDTFSFSCIDEVCVAAALGKITSNATSLDGIPLIFTKFLLPLILSVLTELFNYILTSSTFPCLTFQKPMTVCAMDCSFFSCISATSFKLRQRLLSLLIFFLGIKKLHVEMMFLL